MSERSEHHRPILVRTLPKETGVAIQAMVAVGIFRSVADGVAVLAQEGLNLRLSESPELQEKVSVFKQMRKLGREIRFR